MNELITLDIRGMFKEGEDEKVIDYINEIVRHGCLSCLQNLGINRFQNRNVHWNCLEKLFLTDCKDDSLRNITDAAIWGYQPVLHTLCIKSFRGYNADIVCTLSQLGVSCHETCIPFDNQFPFENCLCEKHN